MSMLDPELTMIQTLASLVAKGKVSDRLTKHWQAYGHGDIQSLVDHSYWELGFGRLVDPARRLPIVTIGINPSENSLSAEAEQPWGVIPIGERIGRWRGSDAWSLGSTDPAEFRRLNGGLDYGTDITWRYFQGIRSLFSQAGWEDLLKGSYSTNINKFTSRSVSEAGKHFDREIEACLPVLKQQLLCIQPRLIVAFGLGQVREPLSRLLGAAKTDLKPIMLTKGSQVCTAYQFEGSLPGLTVKPRVLVFPHPTGQSWTTYFKPNHHVMAEVLGSEIQAIKSQLLQRRNLT